MIPLLGIYAKNPETPVQENLCTPMFIAVLITVAQIWTQAKCTSVTEWIKRLWSIRTGEHYAAQRRKERLPVVEAWMELETIMLSERSQLVKDNYYIVSLI